MILLLGFAFLSGLVTILAPCIWPLLPIILSSSIAGQGHKRPLGITLGIMLSFAVFTLTISSLVKLFHFDPNILRLLAVIVIGFLGLTMVIPSFSTFTESLISRLTGAFGNNKQRGGFGGGFITGVSLGIIWSPCAGPILAAIAALAATGQVGFNTVLVTLFYVLGTGIPLFIFAFGGQQLFNKVHFISSHTGAIQRIFGVIMLLTALAIYTNYDQYLQTKLLDMFPQFNNTIDSFESSSSVQNQLNILKGNQSTPTVQPPVSENGLFNTDTPAPDFTGATNWLNTQKPLSISDLRGKVVLVDFWTYTCINCIRTLPHVTSWYEKYKDQGFVVIGVHTPEFEFEKDTGNVQAAIKRFNITYPVPQDNDYSIWNSYNNQYWPAEYLIDAQGNIRREEFGEGNYDQTEQAIQTLLKESGKNVTASLDTMPDQTPTEQISPETYLGSNRMQFYYPTQNTGNVSQIFTLNNSPPKDSFSLGGQWSISGENAMAGNNATLNYHFYANKVFLVLNPGSVGPGVSIKVLLDGVMIAPSSAGDDVKNGIVTVDSDRLYSLVNLKGIGEHILQLQFLTPGVQIFAFTFG